MAWPLIEQRLRGERTRVVEHFNRLRGTGLASTDLRTVAEAAAVGRVETLFVRADPWCWEAAAEGSAPAVVQLGADQWYAACEQVDAAVIATLNSSGQVYATSQPVTPDGEVAAVFRY